MISRRVARMPAVRSFLVVVGTGMCYVGVMMVFLWPTPSIKVKHDSFFLCVVVAMTRDVEWGEVGGRGGSGGGGFGWQAGNFSCVRAYAIYGRNKVPSMYTSMHMCVQMGADILFHDAKAVSHV